jgi:chromosome segregation ATPase
MSSSEFYVSNQWNVSQLKVLGYKTGSVLRVRMLNFLTFDDCEVFPGPRLNVILGPNGTGKSAITHAICLTCCGKPEIVGRSNDLSQFVKHGKEGQEAFTEVDFLLQSEVLTVRRAINSDSATSIWFINKRKATMAQVKEQMVKLKIDVNNLCTFMSQDKVGQFTQQTPQGILQKTLQSIQVSNGSDRNLYEEQMDLSNIEETKNIKQRELEICANFFEAINQEHESMQVEVERYQQRKETKTSLEHHNIKLIVNDALAEKQKKIAKQTIVDNATRELEENKGKVTPLLAIERDLKRNQATLQKTAENCKKTFQTELERLNNCKEVTLENIIDVENASNNLKLIEQDRKSNEKKLVLYTNEIQAREEELRISTESIPQIKDKLQHFKALNDEKYNIQNELDDSQTEIQQDINNEKAKVDQAKNELGKMKDMTQLFLNKLRKMHGKQFHDAANTLEWFEKHKNDWISTGKLKGQIMGPVAIHMNIKDPAVAIMFQKSIPDNRLLGYVVQCDEDKDFFVREGNKARHVIDVFTMNRVPSIPQQRPLNQFRNIGMQGFLSDQVECPTLVRNFLTTFHNIHKIMWARKTANTIEINENHIKDFLYGNEIEYRLLYDETYGSKTVRRDHPYSITEIKGAKSIYSGLVSDSRIAVRAFHSLLGETVEDDKSDRKNELVEIIDSARKEISRCDVLMKKKIEQNRTLASEISVNKNHIIKLKKGLDQPKLLTSHLNNKRKLLADVEKILNSDTVSEKRLKQSEYKKAIEAQLDAIDASDKQGKALCDFKIESEVADYFRLVLVEDIRTASENVRIAQDSLQSFERAKKQAENDRDEQIRLLSQKEAKTNELINKYGGQQAFTAVWTVVVVKVLENDLGLLQQKIEELQSELDSAVDNDDILERFNAVSDQKLKTEAEFNQLTVDFADLGDSLNERSQGFIQHIQSIAEKLNASFGEYMKRLQYSGEIELRMTGSIDKYQMQMMVKFREDVKLADLDGNRHSGGERAVSTIMYLMTLQDLTAAPFRVVDEVNQGMDERNERLVFDRIVSNCTGDAQKPQYFLVSPKLLQGLRSMEHDDVTVLLVLNGPGVASKWQVPEIVSALSEHNHKSLENGGGKSKKRLREETV